MLNLRSSKIEIFMTQLSIVKLNGIRVNWVFVEKQSFNGDVSFESQNVVYHSQHQPNPRFASTLAIFLKSLKSIRQLFWKRQCRRILAHVLERAAGNPDGRYSSRQLRAGRSKKTRKRMRTGGDGGTGSGGGNRHRVQHNTAQFINTLGLVAPLGPNGEIDMPAEVGERASERVSCYKPERKCQDKMSCTEHTAQSARKQRYNQDARKDVNCIVKQNSLSFNLT